MPRIDDYPPSLQQKMRAMVDDPAQWPNPNLLPMKRPTDRGIELATMFPKSDKGYVLRIDYGVPTTHTYQTADEIFADNWVVD